MCAQSASLALLRILMASNGIMKHKHSPPSGPLGVESNSSARASCTVCPLKEP